MTSIFRPVLEDGPSGSVAPVGVNVTETDKSHSGKLSSIHEDSVADNIKIIRKNAKILPKFPANIRRKTDTLVRLKITNRILRRKLDQALKGNENMKISLSVQIA